MSTIEVTEILSPSNHLLHWVMSALGSLPLNSASLGRVIFSPSICVVGSRSIENEAVSLDKGQEVEHDLLRRLVHLAHQ
jgi:hypothetical protein